MMFVCLYIWLLFIIDEMYNVLQLTTKSFSTTSQTELENRLHALTESLIHKQTMLEALSTEKNSLGLQLERLEVSSTEIGSSCSN